MGGGGTLGSNEQGLLGSWPGSRRPCCMWGACAGSTMELVYVLVAAVLAAAGPAPPCWSPDLCVLLVTGEGQVQALLPLMSPSLQHVRSEPAESSLRGWAPRLLAPWAPRRCLLPCPIGSPLQTAILVNPGFASVSSATLTPRLSLGAICLRAGCSPEQGWPKAAERVCPPSWGAGGMGDLQDRGTGGPAPQSFSLQREREPSLFQPWAAGSPWEGQVTTLGSATAASLSSGEWTPAHVRIPDLHNKHL